MSDKIYLLTSIQAAIHAGTAILDVYRSTEFEIEEKADNSPLTLADRRSHEVIVDYLAKFDIPILSEEGRDIPYQERNKWDTYWLIDPLDGTKEFIKKNGEFTVNIAMIHQNKPIDGVVYVPDRDTLYFASTEIGSYKADAHKIAGLLDGQSERPDQSAGLSDSGANQRLKDLIDLSTILPINPSTNRPYTIAGSRSHATPELEAVVEEKRREHGKVEFISAGSSLKLCLVAEGRADIYPRTGPTMEWDTAAGQTVVECSGGKVYKYDTEEPLNYNKENLLNPWFVAVR
ncbi:3'(2'),5'-bisphosphate nucleotidase (EC [Olavius sp. associated proteobacterium Delta 1]|nr:3'(2'),5'-bisphosphate nucleotidase (EC [Olavius sp. associated proteobacterium Delta 1]